MRDIRLHKVMPRDTDNNIIKNVSSAFSLHSLQKCKNTINLRI